MTKLSKKCLLLVLATVVVACASLFLLTNVKPATVSAASTKYEAENATLASGGGEVKYTSGTGSYAFGVSGTGFVGMADASGADITFSNVSVSSSGLYELNIKYAHDKNWEASGDQYKIQDMPTYALYVNNSFNGDLKFRAHNGWGSFNITDPMSLHVSLNSGNNTIKLVHLSWCMEIDYIEIGNKVADYTGNVENIQNVYYLQAEDATVIDCTKKYVSGDGSYAQGVNGSGFVGNIDNTTSSIEFSASVDEAGYNGMFIKYASGNYDLAGPSIKVYVNGTFKATVALMNTSGWGSFNVTPAAYIALNLTKPATIKLVKGDGNVEIDFIAICGNVDAYNNGGSGTVDPDPTPTPGDSNAIAGTYEAENAKIVNCARKSGYGSGYSGGGFVGDLNNSDCYVEFTVTPQVEGTYTVKVHCASGANTGVSVTVYAGEHRRNGRYQSYGTQDFTAINGWGGFSSSTWLTFSVGLKAEESFIIVRADFIEIDCIKIEQGCTAYVDGTNEVYVSGSGEFDGDWGGGDDYVQYPTNTEKKGGSNSGSSDAMNCNVSFMGTELTIVSLILIAGTVVILLRRKSNQY